MTGRNTRKGFFKPANPSKYIGDPTQIIYRSGWELRVMQYLDKNPNVIEWRSEEVAIPYRSPVDNRLQFFVKELYVTI